MTSLYLELGLTEESDSIDINGVTFQKPFVEKPLYAEDHRVHIYYPSSAGGGQTQLFRKVETFDFRITNY